MGATVTIILPCRNGERHLPETLEAVAKQTFTDWKLLFVDDGSTDSTLAIVENFMAQVGREKVEIIPSGGVGAAQARNIATDRADSRFIAFLDADDVWLPAKLQTQITAMLKAGAAFSYTGYRKIDDASKPGDIEFPAAKDVSYRRLLYSNPIRCFTVVYDVKKLGRIHMPTIKMRNDLLAWLEVMKRLESRKSFDEILSGAQEPAGASPVLGIDQTLGFYRQHTGSLTGNKRKAASYQWKAYRDYLKLSWLSSAYYFIHYALNGILSYNKR